MPAPTSRTAPAAATFRGARRLERRSTRSLLSRTRRNARRRLYGWLAGVTVAGLMRVPYPLMRAVWRHLGAPVLRLALWRPAERNLRRGLPALTRAERGVILRRMFDHSACLAADWLAYAAQGPAFIDRRVDERAARAHLQQFESCWPGGWVGITGHMGNWELLAQWMQQRSARPGGTIAKRQPNPYLNRVVDRLRGRFGMTTLYTDEPPQRTLRVLRSGRVVGTAPDQDIQRLAGAFVDFLGHPAYTPLGPARLALAAHVPIIVGTMLRQGDGYMVWLSDPLWPDYTAPKHDEILRLTRAWCQQLEAVVRAHPDQWPWFHDRWRTTPELLAEKGRERLPDGGAAVE